MVKGKKLGSSKFLTDKDILKLKALYNCLGKLFMTNFEKSKLETEIDILKRKLQKYESAIF